MAIESNPLSNTNLLPPCHCEKSSNNHRFAILLGGHASEYVRKQYNGVASLFIRMLSDPGEIWDTYHVVGNEFPCDQDLDHYDAFIVTGSRHDAHGNEPWVLRLCELLWNIHHTKKKKLLGVCFGHQVISRALGGKTGRALNGWECGLKKITITKAMYSKPYGHQLPSSLNIIKIHQDEVFEIPHGGQVLASSTTTQTEIYAVRDEILGIQGHPEFTEDIVLDLFNSCLKNIVLAKTLEQGVLSFKQGRADHKIFKQLCKAFLKDTHY